MRWRLALFPLLVCLGAAACLSPDHGPAPPVPTAVIPPPVPAAGQGHAAPRSEGSTPPSLPTQPAAAVAPGAPIDGRLLVATTRFSPRPQSDLRPDYRLAWWSRAGLQPVRLPDDDRGVIDAAARPGGGALAAIVGGVTLLRASDAGESPVDLLPRLGGAQPGAVEEYLSVAWAGADRLLVRQTPPAGISLIDASGQSRSHVDLIGLNPAVAPDGQHLALGHAGDNPYYSIYVADQPFADLRKLTGDDVLESTPAWSPDGAWLVYAAQPNAGSPPGWVVRVVRADGTAEQTIIGPRPGVSYSSLRWSPDGQRIAFTRYEDAAHTRQIGIVNRDGSNPTTISTQAANDRILDWAP
jgi:WD40-like Beta Propeller Repeat